MKRTERNLEDMLRPVRENRPTRPLFSPGDIREIIERERPADAAATAGPGGRSSFNAFNRPYIIMTFISAIILAGALLLHFGKNDTAPPNRTTTPERIGEHIAGDRQNDFSPSVPATPSGKSDKKKAVPPAGMNNDLLPPDAGNEKKGTEKKSDEPAETGHIAGAVLTGLTPEELEQVFGIRRDGDKTVIPVENMMQTVAIPRQALPNLHDLGYDTAAAVLYLRSRAVVALGPGSVMGNTVLADAEPDRLIASPVALTVLEEEGNSSGLMMSLGNDDRIGRIGKWDREIDGEIMNLSESKGKIEPESGLARLIAVRVPAPVTDGKGKESHRDIIVWYIPTPDLVAALPKRCVTPRITALADAVYPERRPLAPTADDTRLIPGMLRFVTRGPMPDDTAAHYKDEVTSLNGNADIAGIRFLDLTREEQERIGLRFTGSGISFEMEQQFERSDVDTYTGPVLENLGYDLSEGPVDVGFRVTADTFAMDYTALEPEEITPSTLKPVLYSGRWTKPEGRQGLSMIFTTGSPLLRKLGDSPEKLTNEVFDAYDNPATDLRYRTLNKLVPVRIRLESAEYIERAKRNRGGEIVLWYVPTPEFVQALPDRYRAALEKELDLIASVEEGNLPPGEICRQMAGENVLMDFCRTGSGAVSYTRVWPNPAREDLTVHYVLTAPRRVAITLHDLSGRFLTEIAGYRQQPAGAHQEKFALDREAVESGTYLVTLRTDQGEQGVQRIVVE